MTGSTEGHPNSNNLELNHPPSLNMPSHKTEGESCSGHKEPLWTATATNEKRIERKIQSPKSKSPEVWQFQSSNELFINDSALCPEVMIEELLRFLVNISPLLISDSPGEERCMNRKQILISEFFPKFKNDMFNKNFHLMGKGLNTFHYAKTYDKRKIPGRIINPLFLIDENGYFEKFVNKLIEKLNGSNQIDELTQLCFVLIENYSSQDARGFCKFESFDKLEDINKLAKPHAILSEEGLFLESDFLIEMYSAISPLIKIKIPQLINQSKKYFSDGVSHYGIEDLRKSITILFLEIKTFLHLGEYVFFKNHLLDNAETLNLMNEFLLQILQNISFVIRRQSQLLLQCFIESNYPFADKDCWLQNSHELKRKYKKLGIKKESQLIVKLFKELVASLKLALICNGKLILRNDEIELYVNICVDYLRIFVKECDFDLSNPNITVLKFNAKHLHYEKEIGNFNPLFYEGCILHNGGAQLLPIIDTNFIEIFAYLMATGKVDKSSRNVLRILHCFTKLILNKVFWMPGEQSSLNYPSFVITIINVNNPKAQLRTIIEILQANLCRTQGTLNGIDLNDGLHNSKFLLLGSCEVLFQILSAVSNLKQIVAGTLRSEFECTNLSRFISLEESYKSKRICMDNVNDYNFKTYEILPNLTQSYLAFVWRIQPSQNELEEIFEEFLKLNIIDKHNDSNFSELCFNQCFNSNSRFVDVDSPTCLYWEQIRLSQLHLILPWILLKTDDLLINLPKLQIQAWRENSLNILLSYTVHHCQDDWTHLDNASDIEEESIMPLHYAKQLPNDSSFKLNFEITSVPKSRLLVQALVLALKTRKSFSGFQSRMLESLYLEYSGESNSINHMFKLEPHAFFKFDFAKSAKSEKLPLPTFSGSVAGSEGSNNSSEGESNISNSNLQNESNGTPIRECQDPRQRIAERLISDFEGAANAFLQLQQTSLHDPRAWKKAVDYNELNEVQFHPFSLSLDNEAKCRQLMFSISRGIRTVINESEDDTSLNESE